MKKILICLTAILTFSLSAWAYEVNPIMTAMPALTIAPDAHAAGMGDIGAATTPDMNSQYWNAAKYAFIEDKGGISASYTPWLRKLVNDIDLAYLTGFYRFDELQAISASFTYFSMGEVALIPEGFNSSYSDLPSSYATAKPNEWSLDVAYSRKLHEYVSMAATLRFMYSDLNNGYNSSAGSYTSAEMFPAWTFAADVSLYYRQPIELPMGTSHFGLGFIVSNLGGKMSYKEGGEDANFIPAKLRIGASYEIPFDDYNRLMASVECDRIMAPSTYSLYTEDEENHKWNTKDPQEYSKISSPRGWFQSFNDAPGGTAEEFKEMRWGVGLEYSYNRQFFGRVGYSHEDKMKGNRRYVTLGAGFKLSIVRFDVAYCIATAASNPLDQTMRFTLGFDLAGIKDLVNNER